jgi:hypothetical protein
LVLAFRDPGPATLVVAQVRCRRAGATGRPDEHGDVVLARRAQNQPEVTLDGLPVAERLAGTEVERSWIALARIQGDDLRRALESRAEGGSGKP